MRAHRVLLLAALAALYLFTPGHPQLPAAGSPLGAAGTIALAIVVGVAVLYRRAAVSTAALATIAAALVMASGGKLGVARAVGPLGWTARYYANERFEGAPEWSSDWRLADATRLDPAIAFVDGTLPVHYLNELRFDRTDLRRDIVEPMSVEWLGRIAAPVPMRRTLAVTARGSTLVELDGKRVLSFEDNAARRRAAVTITLGPGAHDIRVCYVKRAGVEAAIEFGIDGKLPGMTGEFVVRPFGHDRQPPASSWRAIAWCLHGIFVLAAGAIAWIGERGTERAHQIAAGFRGSWTGRARAAAAAVLTMFAIQGAVQARHFAGHATVLTGGDDWFYFESSARDVLHGDLLMTFGRPLGQGRAYYSYPLYSYTLAAVHRLAGEDLFAPIFVQFLLLGIAALVATKIVGWLIGESATPAALVAAIALIEIEFPRYYTVTLLSENLYIVTVALCLLMLVRWAQERRARDLLLAGVWGGVSALTRPAMMIFYVPAVLYVGFGAWTSRAGVRRSLRAALSVALTWMTIVVPATIRNFIVSGQPVLIAGGLGATLIRYNLPAAADPAHYYALAASGGVLSSLAALLQIARDYPRELLAIQVEKLAFSVGMVHLHAGFRPHPELVATTVAYALAFVLHRRVRAFASWPIHLFVIAHLTGMALTQPWTYGYRLILPPFVFTGALAAGAWQDLAMPFLPRRFTRSEGLEVVHR